MKKKAFTKTQSIIFALVVVILVLAAYFIYSRPMPIQQRYPMLSLDKCTELRGYYEIDGQTELTEFTIDKNSEDFEILCSLLYEQGYRRSLRDLLPRGTRIHPTESGDFEWEVCFYFDAAELPDGNSGSGGILRIQCWYDELDIHFNDEIFSCYINEQETWAKEVLNTILSVD